MKPVSVLESPLLTGLAREAHTLVETAGFARDLTGTTVLLDAHQTLAATPSFADELVRNLIVERNADKVLIWAAGLNFTRWLHDAARRRDVAGRVVDAAPDDMIL